MSRLPATIGMTGLTGPKATNQNAFATMPRYESFAALTQVRIPVRGQIVQI